MARVEQDREHVVAPLVGGAALVDELEDQRVDALAQVDESGHRAGAVEQRLESLRGRAEQRHRLLTEREHLAERRAHGREALALVEAEDRAQDHLERQALHPRV